MISRLLFLASVSRLTVPDPNLAGMPRRSRNSTRPSRHWITIVDGTRLREARIERGLSRDKLANQAGVSPSTMARLESQSTASCHRATLYRIAATLADDPRRVISALAIDGAGEARGQRVLSPGPASAWLCSRIFPARPDQVGQARAFLGRVLHGCPLIYEAQVICSELVTNAVRHSRSAALPGGRVIVRAEVRERDYIWLEVEDQGGDWGAGGGASEGGLGLEVVAALSDYWDIRGDENRRMVCARIDWPEPDQ